MPINSEGRLMTAPINPDIAAIEVAMNFRLKDFKTPTAPIDTARVKPASRDATAGPWIALGELELFRRFCEANGHKTRDHSGFNARGAQIRHGGHWMAVIWNKGTKRSPPIAASRSSFKASQQRKPQPRHPPDPLRSIPHDPSTRMETGSRRADRGDA